MTQSENPWKTLSSRAIHTSPWLTLYEDKVVKPNGEQGTYTYTIGPPFVLAIAYDGTHFIMIRQYRYALKRVITEFPGGSIDEGEDPLESAKRELQEETGVIAKTWTRLGTILNPNTATVFLAQDLQGGNRDKMEEDGIQSVIKPTHAELDCLIAREELTDSKTLAALLLFEKHLQNNR